MDRVILNIVCLLVSGTGIFSALTKFYVPELDAAFLGNNPFAIKANTIDSVTTKIFVALGIIGLILQAGAIIYDDQLPKALHSKCFYITVFLIGLCFSLIGIWVLKNTGDYISRKIWLPKVIKSQNHLYNSARFILDHDGWRQDQLTAKGKLTNPEKYRQVNFQQAEKNVSQIEKLLDVKHKAGGLKIRISRLEPYFSKQKP